jgi:HAE1 family hydrophobic/amphiphilic exporter-1
MLAMAIALIYLIMVAQFQSLLSPFIVMFTIPLAFTGGFMALIITGNPVSIVAFLGLIILTGVVVNNGIVFVDYINILRRAGMPKREAIIQAGNVRLRPILMTALTTIIALSTMSLGFGTGTEMIQPMAITAIGGLIYATILTLIVIPVLYDLLFKKEKPAQGEV